VLASGRGAIADQILAIAFAQGVRVREDADLAEVLAAVDVDSEIPVEALVAVAEILSYVYRANGRLRGDADDPVAPPLAAGPLADEKTGPEDTAPGDTAKAWQALFGNAAHETAPPNRQVNAPDRHGHGSD